MAGDVAVYRGYQDQRYAERFMEFFLFRSVKLVLASWCWSRVLKRMQPKLN